MESSSVSNASADDAADFGALGGGPVVGVPGLRGPMFAGINVASAEADHGLAGGVV